MPQRTSKQSTEDISRAAFRLLAPAQWVIRDKATDYGIDLEIELFGKEGRALGLIVQAQLKATALKQKASTCGVSIKIDRIQYYQSLNSPVLVILYVQASNLFYWKWANDIDLHYAKDDATTYRVIFSENDIWTSASPEKIQNTLQAIYNLQRGNFSFPISISLQCVPKIFGTDANEIDSALRKRLARAPGFFTVVPQTTFALIRLRLLEDRFVAAIEGSSGFVLDNLKSRSATEFVYGICEYMVCGIAVALGQVGQRGIAAEVAACLKPDVNVVQANLMAQVALYLVQVGRISEALAIASQLGDDAKGTVGKAVVHANALRAATDRGDPSTLAQFQAYLASDMTSQVAKGDKASIANAQYNLGNFLRGRGDLRKALALYKGAAKNDPIYITRSYYHEELGGLFFDAGRYKASAKYYAKALELDHKLRVRPYYADALMRCGQYEAAVKIFAEGFSSGAITDSKWAPVYFALEQFVANEIKTQNRESILARRVIESMSSKDDVKMLCERAIRHDALCGTAWFNLGVSWSLDASGHEETSLWSKAGFAFLIAAAIHPKWAEAWENVMICAVNYKVGDGAMDQMAQCAVQVAYSYCGEEFMMRMNKRFSDFPSFVAELRRVTDNAVVKKKPLTIRFLHDDGNVNEILTPG